MELLDFNVAERILNSYRIFQNRRKNLQKTSSASEIPKNAPK